MKPFIVLLPPLLLANPPKWYIQQSLKPKRPNTYIGYGEGKSLKEAVQSAKSSIAHTIETTIQDTTVQIRQRQGDEFKSAFATSSKQTSGIVLKDTKILKQICQADGFLGSKRCFVAVSFWSVSDLYRFADKLHGVEAKQHPYLAQTPLIKRLNAYTQTSLDYSLISRNGRLHIEHDGLWHPLSDDERRELLATTRQAQGGLALELVEVANGRQKTLDVLKQGDAFHLRIRTPKDGFVSVFMVYEDTTVVSVLQSQSITKDQALLFPDLQSDYTLEAGLVQKGKATKDMFVVVFGEEPLGLDAFVRIGQSIEKDPKAKAFDVLINAIRQQAFATKVVVTAPR